MENKLECVFNILGCLSSNRNMSAASISTNIFRVPKHELKKCLTSFAC